jgi:hypothetical protein
MRKINTTILILMMLCIHIHSQERTQPFELLLSKQKYQYSLYNKIKFIDARTDTAILGVVQQTIVNLKAAVIPKYPLREQVSDLLKSIVDSTASNGELLFQLRQLQFMEVSGMSTEVGTCYIRIGLYTHQNNVYRQLKTLDTTVIVKAASDVTSRLLRYSSNAISDFILQCTYKKPVDTSSLSLSQVIKIDSIEKKDMPAYNNEVLKEGIYFSYKSFKNQIPDCLGEVTMDEGVISKVTINEGGNKNKLKRNKVYAIVDKGQAYISTEFDYYPLRKIDNAFYFNGKSKITANSGAVLASTLLFGYLGAAIASNDNALFEMKIDHLNGTPIRMKQLN